MSNGHVRMYLRRLDLLSLPNSPVGYAVRRLIPGEERAWWELLDETGDLGIWNAKRAEEEFAAPSGRVWKDSIHLAVSEDRVVGTACVQVYAERDDTPELGWVAVAGARRPQAEIQILKQLQEKVELCAVCDPNETLWSVWKEQFPGARFHRTFDDLLSDDTVDAIFVATPLRMHADQAVAAMTAGKHVLSEVPACYTLEQCWSLVET